MFTSKSVRRVLVGVMAVPLMFSIQGCNDSDALAAIGAIAIIGGAIAVGASGAGAGGHHHHPRPPRHGRWHSVSMVDDSAEMSETEELNSAALMAARYNISISAAKTLKASLKASVEGQTLQPIYELGLSQDDLQSLGQNQGVSSEAISKLSSKLSLSADQTRAMVQQMMVDAQQSQNTQFAVQ